MRLRLERGSKAGTPAGHEKGVGVAYSHGSGVGTVGTSGRCMERRQRRKTAIQIVCLTEAKVRMPLPLVDTLHSPSNG